MSEFSIELLKSSHKGVHEQLDMLVAAMRVQLFLQSDIIRSEIEDKSRKKIKKWVKSKVTQSMKEMGYSPGFMKRGHLLYVFQLFEEFYESYTSIFIPKPNTKVLDTQYSILQLASVFLDNQFAHSGRADICKFLEKDLRNIL